MRYRALDQNGDYTFGQGQLNYLIDSPAAVAQAILTRLLLFLGEFFLDTTAGTPWTTEVIGVNTGALYDMVVQNQILGTQGVVNGAITNVVLSITTYSSSLSGTELTIDALEVITIFSAGQPLSVISSPIVVTGGYGVGGYGENPYGE